MKVWFAFSTPPKISSYEHEQRARLLYFMLMAIFSGGLVNCVFSYLNGRIVAGTILALLTLSCLAGFYLHHIHRYSMAAWMICISFYVGLVLLLYQDASLDNAALLAFPGFMLCSAFLFSTRGLLISLLASLLAVFMFSLHPIAGIFESIHQTSLWQAMTVSVIFLAMVIMIWIVQTTWEMNLALLTESYDLTLQGWARALEYRDGETLMHCRRVTKLSVAIGKRFGLKAEDITNIRRGSYLHDIGKMAIPDSILLKPGPLTDKEWEVMKQHTVRARELLSEIPFLRGAIPIPYSHHERWDGMGYPDGLQGENIPFIARIFSVVDNWDALTSDRPYRKAWSQEEAIAFLKENSGKMFDPKVVDVFLSIVSKTRQEEIPQN